MSEIETPPIRGSAQSASPAAVGFWKRGLARGLDTLFLFMFAFGIKTALALGFGIAWDRPSGTGSTAAFWLISVTGTTAYYVVFELLAGTTFGKAAVGAQVVALDLGAIRTAQAVKRSAAFFVDALFFGMIAAAVMSESPLKQRIGDSWAKTRVVRRRALSPTLRTRPTRIVSAGLAALSCSAASTIAMALL